MSVFTLGISYLTTSNLPWFTYLSFQVPSNIVLYNIGFCSITSHIHNWALFLLWLHLFILSEVISSLFSSSILGTYQSGEFISLCHTILPFHTVHVVLKPRILKCFAIPFFSGPHFVKTLHHDLSILGSPTCHGSWTDSSFLGILQARRLGGLPCPSSGNLSVPWSNPRLFCLQHGQAGSLTLVPPGKAVCGGLKYHAVNCGLK